MIMPLTDVRGIFIGRLMAFLRKTVKISHFSLTKARKNYIIGYEKNTETKNQKGAITMLEFLAANPMTGTSLPIPLFIITGVVLVACIVVSIIAKNKKNKKK